MQISDADYETLRAHVAEQFAWLEEHTHGAVKTHVLRLHSYARYAGDSEDAQREIVRPAEGGDKPNPSGP